MVTDQARAFVCYTAYHEARGRRLQGYRCVPRLHSTRKAYETDADSGTTTLPWASKPIQWH